MACKNTFLPRNFQNPSDEGRVGFFYLHVYILVCGWVVVTPQDQTKNDTDLKFGTQIPLDHI